MAIDFDYRAIFEHAGDGMFVMDASRTVLQANRAFAALVGLPMERVIGRTASNFATTFEARSASSRLPDGNTLVVVRLDVTDRYEWERETAEREQRYRLLFEVMPMPAWVYDVETLRFLAVNPAAIAHYGYSEAQLLGMTIVDIRPPEDVELLLAEIRARGGLAAHMRPRGYRHRKADGTVIDVEIASHAFDFDGRSARIVVVNDITEQTRIREREREVEAHLLQAQKMEAVGRLAGGVAHDFNNLLTVVLGAAQSLDAELPPDSPLRAEVGDIRTAVERGAGLTRQLLAFGRKEARAPMLIDVHEVVSGIERLIARVLGETVLLKVHAGAASSHVHADASQLEQVLVNLAFNARDAMPHGGTLTIATTTHDVDDREAETLGVVPGSFFVIEVTDDGVGMDETTRSRAFEPFYTTKGPHLGTGLGLATVYGIVKESAGAVILASTPGVGTAVRIYLPLGVKPTAAAQSSRTNDDAGVVATGELHGAATGRVLLVEDEPRVRAHVRRLLEHHGYSVTEAEDGAEGERRFLSEQGTIDVIVTDVVMPVLGGVEMVARLREIAPRVPVVFVSGFTAEDRSLPLDERTAFVAKPYAIATLSEALRGVMTAAGPAPVA